MKIYEIVEAPEIEKSTPDSNVNPTPRTDRFGKQNAWNRDDLNQVRQQYHKNPELLNLIQAALMLPHIKTMQQAVDYANSELAIRTKQGTLGDRDAVPMRKPKKTAYKGPEGGVAQTEPGRNRLDRFRGYSKDLDDMKGPDETPLGKIASAGASIASAVNQGLDDVTGGKWNAAKVQSAFDDYIGNPLSTGTIRGRSLAKTLTAKK